MGRLTWKKPNGDWGIKGVDFSEVRPAYGALCKLLAYENTGLSPDEVERLKDDLDDWKKARRWIPVEERLPVDGERVLVTMEHRAWISDYDTSWVPEEEKWHHEKRIRVHEALYADGMWNYTDTEEGSEELEAVETV